MEDLKNLTCNDVNDKNYKGWAYDIPEISSVANFMKKEDVEEGNKVVVFLPNDVAKYIDDLMNIYDLSKREAIVKCIRYTMEVSTKEKIREQKRAGEQVLADEAKFINDLKEYTNK